MKNNKVADWLLRFVKGIFIGSGFILPGVSGGALAAVFGIYERMISFVAHITKEFKKNFLYFLPVGFGGVFGVFILSFAVSFLLENYEVPVLWFFIGCILGTLPSLWKEAGKKGRQGKHYGIMGVALVLSFALLLWLRMVETQNEAANAGLTTFPQFPIWAWLLAGGLIGLGVIVPGLSPSNFLIFFGMYGSMSDGIKNFDLAVIIPLGLGVVLCVLALSRVMEIILKKAYAGIFHAIFGIVISSTVMIVPLKYNYLSIGTLVCVVTCVLGAVLGFWMSRLEEKYVPEKD